MMARLAKIIFFGTSEFAVPTLEALIKEGYEIIAVVTNPDEPVGRKQVFTPPPVKLKAQSENLKILQPESLKNNPSLVACLLPLRADVGVVAAYGKIIPKEIIDIFEYGILNIHPSLLPKYRGPTPIQSAILNGEKETGITIIKIDEEVDHGPTLANYKIQISNDKKFKELQDELAKLGADLLIKILPDYLTGKIKLQPQDHLQATFTKKLTREDSKIDWNKTAEEIDHQIRALNPEPGTWTTWNDKILKITGTMILSRSCQNHSIKDGTKVGKVFQGDEGIYVQCSAGCLKILRLQLEGKKPMSAEDFIRGNRDFIGAVLE